MHESDFDHQTKMTDLFTCFTSQPTPAPISPSSISPSLRPCRPPARPSSPLGGESALHPLHLPAFLVHESQMKPDGAWQRVSEPVARLAARDQCCLPKLTKKRVALMSLITNGAQMALHSHTKRCDLSTTRGRTCRFFPRLSRDRAAHIRHTVHMQQLFFFFSVGRILSLSLHFHSCLFYVCVCLPIAAEPPRHQYGSDLLLIPRSHPDQRYLT